MTSTLREDCELITLNVGDLIVDTGCGNVGILVNCVRRISIQDDDVYFWTIHWSKEVGNDSYAPVAIQIEEDGLRLSIVVGLYDLFRTSDSD
jgi:hypothetical protein